MIADTSEMTNSPASIAGAASEKTQRAHSPADAPCSIIAEKVALLAWSPNSQSPSHTDARMMNGVVTGFDRKVIAAPIGILARTGSASSATPRIWTPGIRKKMPTNSPSAVPRGTEVRVKRHK